MKKRNVLVVLLVAMMVLLLASCGTKKDVQEESKDGAEAEAAAEEAAEEEAEEAEAEEAEPKEDYQKWIDDWNDRVAAATKIGMEQNYEYTYLDGHAYTGRSEFFYDAENNMYARGSLHWTPTEDGGRENERYEYYYFKEQDGVLYDYYPLEDRLGEVSNRSYQSPGMFQLYKDQNTTYDLQYEGVEPIELDGKNLIPIQVSGNMTAKIEASDRVFTKEEAEEIYAGENRDVEGYDEALQKVVDTYNDFLSGYEVTIPVLETLYFDAETHDMVSREYVYEYDEDGDPKQLNYVGDVVIEKNMIVAIRELEELTGAPSYELTPDTQEVTNKFVYKVTLDDEVEIPIE